jgi:hypothetical protein
MLELDLPPRLKFLRRASVLWLEVSDRALRAGEGGERSGRGMSDTGVFQKLKSVYSGAHLRWMGGNIWSTKSVI